MRDRVFNPCTVDARLPWALLIVVAVGLAAGVSQRAWSDEGETPRDTYRGEPEAAQEKFDEGEAAREEYRWDDAATLYWAAIEADLRHYRAHVRYQEAALRAGDDKDRMVEDYRSFVEDYPELYALRLHQLRLRPAADRVPELENALAKKAKDFNVHLELGRAHLATGKLGPAKKALEKALALAPASRRDILLLLAETEHLLGETESARGRLTSAIQASSGFFEAHLMLARFDLLDGALDKAVARADTVLELRPTYVAAFLVKSEALSRADKVDEALDALRKAYRITQAVPDIAIAYADLLARQETDKAYAEAIAYYQKVLEADEESWRALYGIGWVHERQEKWEEAEEKYRAAVLVNPTLVQAINSIGYCLFRQGRVTEAQIQFKKALDIDPKYITAQANLGATFDAQAKYTDAIKIYEKILDTKGQKENVRALINCAFDYEALGVFPKALVMLKEAQKLRPKDANIPVWIGDNLYFQKKWKDAEASYQRAIEMDAKSFFAWRGLGYAAGQRKRWTDAVKALEEAKKLKEDDLDILIALGDIYLGELEDLEKALKSYQEYVQRGGNDPAVPEAIVEIQKQLEKKR